MRIDREAFLLAVATLAGCERADTSQPPEPPPADVAVAPAPPPAPKPAPAMAQVTPTPTPAPVAEVTPTPAPAPVVVPKKTARPLSPAKRWFFALDTTQRANVKALCKQRFENPCAGVFAHLKPNRV